MMKRWQIMILTIFLAACASAGPLAGPNLESETNAPSGLGEPEIESKAANEALQPLQVDLDDLGLAPELANETWLNTDQPLRLEDLRGKVVLLEMWTFG